MSFSATGPRLGPLSIHTCTKLGHKQDHPVTSRAHTKLLKVLWVLGSSEWVEESLTSVTSDPLRNERKSGECWSERDR